MATNEEPHIYPVKQYVGARYVPIFGRKNETTIYWDNSKPYEPLSIVLYQGNSFTSKQYVPKGVEITDEEYWALTGNYNAQVEQYRSEVSSKLDTVTHDNTLKGTGTKTDPLKVNLNHAATMRDTGNTVYPTLMHSQDDESNINGIGFNAGYGLTAFNTEDTDTGSGIKLNADIQASIENSEQCLTAMHANTINQAVNAYTANYMDIRKLGCKPDDTTTDNAAIINAWLKANPASALYVPAGNWYVKNTIVFTLNDVVMDGLFIPLADGVYDDGFIVKLIGTNTESQVSYNQAMNKNIRIKVDCNLSANNGILVRNYFETNFELIVIKCLKTGIQVNSHIIECNLNCKVYGNYTSSTSSPDTDFADKGVEILDNQNNDNQATVLARNVKLGIDLNASAWTFHYIHVWGCINVLKVYKNTHTQITKFYTDYAISDSIVSDMPTNYYATIIIENIFGIMLNNSHIIDNGNYAMNITEIHAYYVGDNTRTSYSALTDNIGSRNITISPIKSSQYIIAADDMRTMSIEQLTHKYGDIRFRQCAITITFERDNTWQSWNTWLNSTYANNLKELGYYLPDTINARYYSWGRTTVTYTKTISQESRINIPQLLFIGKDLISLSSDNKLAQINTTDISIED